MWPRHAVEVGFALALLGHLDAAAQLLDYLATRQSPDGRWGQNFAAPADHCYDRGASYYTAVIAMVAEPGPACRIAGVRHRPPGGQRP